MARQRKPLSPSTQTLYAKTLSRAFGNATPTRAPNVAEWPESTRSTLRAAIQRYWNEHGDRARGIELADSIEVARKLKRKMHPPSSRDDEAFQKMLQKSPARIRSVIQVGLGLGLRSEELLGMDRSVFAAAARWGRLTVTGKGFKERVLDCAGVRDAVQVMLACPGSQPHDKSQNVAPYDWEVPGQLLAGPDSSLKTQRNMLSRHIKAIARAAGIDPKLWTPHTLRRVFATRMHRDHAPLPTIQEALGHEDIKTTIKYIGVTPEDVAKYMRRIK